MEWRSNGALGGGQWVGAGEALEIQGSGDLPISMTILVHTCCATALTQEEENSYIKKNTVGWKGSINIEILTP